MINWKSYAGLVALCLTTGVQPASAQFYKSGDLAITGNVAGTTDYVFRGVSQNRRDFAGQANLDLAYKYFYAGLFVSNVDFGRDASGSLVVDKSTPSRKVVDVEIDYYAGFKYPITSKLDVDLGVIYYQYPNAFDGKNRLYRELDYVEGKIALTFKPTDALALSGTFFASPESINETGRVYTLEAGASYTFPAIGKVGTAVSALLGWQAGDSDRFKLAITNGRDSYFYWNVGATATFAERFSIDVRYWNTDIKDNNASGGFSDRFCSGVVLQCDQSVSATAKVTF